MLRGLLALWPWQCLLLDIWLWQALRLVGGVWLALSEGRCAVLPPPAVQLVLLPFSYSTCLILHCNERRMHVWRPRTHRTMHASFELSKKATTNQALVVALPARGWQCNPRHL